MDCILLSCGRWKQEEEWECKGRNNYAASNIFRMTLRIRLKLKSVRAFSTLYLFSMNANVPSVFHPAAEILSSYWMMRSTIMKNYADRGGSLTETGSGDE